MQNSDESDLHIHSSPVVLRSKKALREVRLMDPDEEPAWDEVKQGETDDSEATPNAQEAPDQTDEPPGIPVPVFQQECEKAYQRGFEEGKGAGMEIGRSETHSVLKCLNTLSQELGDLRGKLLDQAEEMTVRLACSIARKVIYREAETDPDFIPRVVRRALSYVEKEERPVIRMNPVDYEQLNEHRGDLLLPDEGIGALEFETDDRIERGGCIIETGSGIVDGRLSSRFERIERALLEEVENG